MRKTLAKLIENYGFIGAIWIYLKHVYSNDGKTRVPRAKFPVHYRKGTFDRYTLKEVFFYEEYNIDFPFSSSDPIFIIDAGANIGFTSIYFSNKYPNATIVAIEPEAENFRYLKSNIEAYPNITGKQCALWSKRTHIEVRDIGFGVRGFVAVEVAKPSGQTVEALTISDIMGDREVIDLLKIDIEGSEKVLFGSNYESWLPRVKCLVIELHDRMLPGCSKSVFTALCNYNFSCFTKGENLCFINEDFRSEENKLANEQGIFDSL